MSAPPPAEGVRQFTVDAEDDGIRLDRWFKRHLPDTSFTTVAKWARTGQLRVDGARATPGDRIAAGQALRVPPPEPKEDAPRRERARPPLSEEQIAFARDMVIHRDAAALVLDKPPGLATQGGTRTSEHVDGLLDALTFGAPVKDGGARPKLVHRLDKDTSGALLVARSARAAAFFARAFSGRTAKKVYWALVVGVPSIEDGTIDLPIAKQPGTGGEKMHVDEAEGQPARSRYRVIERAGNRAAWVELQPFTGRTHQLRVHMAAIGHPIVGDGKYGGAAAFLTGGISRKMHLHARRLRVDHPDGAKGNGPIDVSAPLPAHFAESLKTLGFEEALGDRLPLDEFVPPSGAEKKQAARAHAKTVRKERKGERRARGGDARAAGGDRRGARPASGGRPGGKPPGGAGARLMHPNPAFRTDAADALDRAAAIGLAHVFAATPAGPMVAHAAVTRHGDRLRFHLARANRLTPHLDGAAVLLSVVGAEGYVSPDWYANPRDQVPTWNYLAIEIDGTARATGEAALVEQLDALASAQEPRVNPASPWTRAKMDDARFRAMLRGITGFEVEVSAIRVTDKRSQNKSAADRAGVIAGLLAAGNAALAAAMQAPS